MSCRNCLFGVALALGTVVCGSVSQAAIIAQWTFEANTPPDQFNTPTSAPVLADVGVGTAHGSHASAGTDYTTPVGNGSANSFSSNNWGIGDFYQFQVSSAGFSDISVLFDQTRSATGPTTFDFQFSTDGVTFTTFVDNYTVLVNDSVANGGGGTWNDTTFRPAYRFDLDLSAIAELENDASIFFRLTAQVAGTSTLGTNRVDNFTVEGTAIPAAAVPEPSTLVLFSLGSVGLVCATWRRRKAD